MKGTISRMIRCPKVARPHPSPLPEGEGESLRKPRAFSALATALLAILAAGCQDDEIQSYRVPKPETIQLASQPKETAQPQRFLGVIALHGERTWFFKLVGPTAAVAAEKDNFDRFIQSVRFTNEADTPVTWAVPEGWQEQPGSTQGPVQRYATFRLGPKDEPLELTVTPLGPAAGSVLDNVNRWRGQIGLGPIDESALKTVTTEIDLGGTSATLVDMTGPGGGRPMMPFGNPNSGKGNSDG